MKIINDIMDIPSLESFVITIGNFEGVHQGHQDLLKSVQKHAKELKSKMVVMTFSPHPQKILQIAKNNFMLGEESDKFKLIKDCGADYLVVIEFTRDFSTRTAEDFLENSLFKHPGIKALYLGYDFAFGAKKQGSFEVAKKLSLARNIVCEQEEVFKIQDKIVSSTGIRDFLAQGDVAAAKHMLGRPYKISGLVVRGVGRGKTIGFPTANINFNADLVVPARGVYVTETKYNGVIYKSVTNIGYNPTFKDDCKTSVECHILDFDRDIYGEMIDVSFFTKIRDEKKFASVDELVKQISHDADFARAFQK